VDKKFYAFQSSPKENPDLLIIGLNPSEDTGEDFSYSACGSKNLQTDIALMKEKSPYWSNEVKWPIWMELKKYFHSPQLTDLLANSVYMNQIYFNTKKLDMLEALPGGANAIKVCRELTKEVAFDIIKPKKVLCLGITDCFNGIGVGTDYQELHKRAGKRLLAKKICRGIPVYAIPHPTGARGITNEDIQTVGNLLASELL
jgi:hypothetical protein